MTLSNIKKWRYQTSRNDVIKHQEMTLSNTRNDVIKHQEMTLSNIKK